jgi:hypothetical protein
MTHRVPSSHSRWHNVYGTTNTIIYTINENIALNCFTDNLDFDIAQWTQLIQVVKY